MSNISRNSGKISLNRNIQLPHNPRGWGLFCCLVNSCVSLLVETRWSETSNQPGLMFVCSALPQWRIISSHLMTPAELWIMKLFVYICSRSQQEALMDTSGDAFDRTWSCLADWTLVYVIYHSKCTVPDKQQCFCHEWIIYRQTTFRCCMTICLTAHNTKDITTKNPKTSFCYIPEK